MNRTTWLQDRRMQKFRDVLSRWERKELSAMEAGELLGWTKLSRDLAAMAAIGRKQTGRTHLECDPWSLF